MNVCFVAAPSVRPGWHQTSETKQAGAATQIGNVSAEVLSEVEDFGNGLVNFRHEYGGELGERAICETAVVDGAQLVDE